MLIVRSLLVSPMSSLQHTVRMNCLNISHSGIIQTFSIKVINKYTVSSQKKYFTATEIWVRITTKTTIKERNILSTDCLHASGVN